MIAQWLIEKKRDGKSLDRSELREFIQGFTDGLIPDYQASAWAMAVYFQGMTSRETADLTTIMMESGEILDSSRLPGVKVDKHSTGGIGDKISIVLAPLAAACGLTVPMISGRGLGITGGTLDKLESIPGYRTDLSIERFLQVLESCGCSLIGQTAEIAPADRKLYALRDVTATVPSIPLIVSSILSKKLAEGLDALVLDVKCGSGAFMKTRDQARALAQALVDTGQALGKKTTAFMTDMNQPLGRSAGNALEIREALEVLEGRGPDDVRILTLALVESMLSSAGIDHPDPVAVLDDGRALQRFRDMVSLHGGRLEDGLPEACEQVAVTAPRNGYVARADAEAIGKACLMLGAGRKQTSDTVDPAVGIAGIRKIGEAVDVGEPLCIIHSNGHEERAAVQTLLEEAFSITEQPPKPGDLIHEVLSDT